MSVLITDDILQQANLSESEFRLEVAIYLFQREVFTLVKRVSLREYTPISFKKYWLSEKYLLITMSRIWQMI